MISFSSSKAAGYVAYIAMPTLWVTLSGASYIRFKLKTPYAHRAHVLLLNLH